MRDRNIMGLFFGFCIFFFAAFSFGLVAGKRLAGTQENQVVIEENHDPWALNRDYEETEEKSWADEGELSYETPAPELENSGGIERSWKSEKETIPPQTASTSVNKEEKPQTPAEKEQTFKKVAQIVPVQEEETKPPIEKKQPPSATEESVELRIRRIEEEKFATELPIQPGGGVYTVQIGSFRAETDAQKIAQALESKGYPVFTKKADIPGKGAWYRVRVGTFPTKQKAKLYGDTLKSREPAVRSVFVTAND